MGRFLRLAASQYSLKTKSMCDGRDSQAGKGAVAVPDGQSSIAGTHIVGGENQIHVCVHTNVLF